MRILGGQALPPGAEQQVTAMNEAGPSSYTVHDQMPPLTSQGIRDRMRPVPLSGDGKVALAMPPGRAIV